MKSIRLLLPALLLLGCSSQSGAGEPAAVLLGGSVWQVAAIDGRGVVTRPGDDGIKRAASFTFGQRSYGGSVGCNALGGLYAQVGKRLYTMPGPQTAMACSGAVGQQEDAANAILNASPLIEPSASGIVLSGGGRRMELTRLGAAGAVDPPEAWQGRGVAGQSYTVHSVNGGRTDGRRLWGKRPPQLRFAGGRVTMSLDCPKPAQGSYAEASGRIAASGLSATCRSPNSRDGELAAILAAGARTVSGPNGELLLASRAGWATLWNDRRDRPK